MNVWMYKMLNILTACPQLINSFKYVFIYLYTFISSTILYWAFNGRAFKSHLTFFLHLVINKCDSRLLIPTIRYHHYQKEFFFLIYWAKWVAFKYFLYTLVFVAVWFMNQVSVWDLCFWNFCWVWEIRYVCVRVFIQKKELS